MCTNMDLTLAQNRSTLKNLSHLSLHRELVTEFSVPLGSQTEKKKTLPMFQSSFPEMYKAA